MVALLKLAAGFKGRASGGAGPDPSRTVRLSLATVPALIMEESCGAHKMIRKFGDVPQDPSVLD
jgi:hypothetical protein